MPDKASLELTVSGTLPGEGGLKAIFEYAGIARQTMDPVLLKRFDALLVQMAEDTYKVWRGMWVKAGVLE